MKKYTFFLIAIIAVTLGCGGSQRDYTALHRSALVADMHSDTALRMMRGFDFSQRDTIGHMDIPRLEEGGVDLQVFACFLSTETPAAECRPLVDRILDSLTAQINRNPDKIEICRTAGEAEDIIGRGKIAAFLGIENGVAINDSLENLRHFYDRGVRYMTLTHTASNDWCISSADTTPAFDGLTEFGEEVVRTMNELGMIVDVSHASPAAVAKVLQVSTDPVIASHSCVYAICPHDRNLTDDQIKAIAAKGGVIGINFYGGYLSPGNRWTEIWDSGWAAHKAEIDSIDALYADDRARRREALQSMFDSLRAEVEKLDISVATVVDHIDYIVKLVGPDYVGLGSDFDGVFGLPRGLKDCSMVPNITKELVARGYSDRDIQKILGGNFMRVFHRVCDKSTQGEMQAAAGGSL
jgi:membrane dipeptidase